MRGLNVASARILVVDDNPATLYPTSHVLRSTGRSATEAATGSEAIKRADEDIDLIALDVNLPDFNGFEVCRKIRERENRANPGDPSVGNVCNR